MLSLVMTDIGVVQTPMFHVTRGRFAVLLPGYGPSRVRYGAALSTTFHATSELLLSLAWTAVLAVAVATGLRRAVGLPVATTRTRMPRTARTTPRDPLSGQR